MWSVTRLLNLTSITRRFPIPEGFCAKIVVFGYFRSKMYPSPKKCRFYQPEMSFSDRNSVFRSHCGHFEEKYCGTDRVLSQYYWLYLVKMIYLYFIIYALNRWELVIVLFQHFNTTLIILQSLNYSKLSENLPCWPIFQPILNDCYNYNRFMGFILSMGNYGDHLPHISTMRGH